MSDSTKTILWIALAVVVILVIVAVVMSSRRRRALDGRRFQAGELRAEAQEKAPLLQESADRASVTERIAADARDVADEKAAAAAALDDQARAQRAKADGVKVERDDLTREADRIDPDVTTDDAGHRVDQHDEDGRHDSEQENEEPADREHKAETASSSGAESAESAGVLGGASTLDDHDDEPDLADAQDPFATAGDEAAAAGYDEDMKKKKKRSTAKTETPGTAAVSSDPSTSETVSDPTAGERETDHEGRADEADAAEQASTGDGPRVATATAPTKVTVPALDDRDDVLAGGGPPDNDPGDHRGQPWATTPGEPGLDEGDEVADNTDEGFAAHTPSEAAPDTDTDRDRDRVDHDSGQRGNDASRDDLADTAASETAAPAETTDPPSADSAGDGPEAASPAPEASDEPSDESADEPSGDEANRHAEPEEASSADAQAGAERRVSGFDEVVDGGYGIGSARPIDDGAQPLAHPVKAWTDRKSFVSPGDEGYDGAEPDVWFYNEDAARRAGFGRDAG